MPLTGVLDLAAVGRRDRHPGRAVIVIDVNVGAGFLLQLVDHLAFRTDHLAYLVVGYLKGQDLGSVLAHVITRLRQSGFHHVQNGQPGLAGLPQGASQHLGGNAVYLGVELQGGHIVAGAGHFEVHVAVGIFGAQDGR